MAQQMNPQDQALITSLLARQDEVIDQLEQLESRILSTVENLNLARQEKEARHQTDLGLSVAVVTPCSSHAPPPTNVRDARKEEPKSNISRAA